MSKNDEEIYEVFRERAREDYFGSGYKSHPHSTPKYVEWMANVWRMNDERNKASKKHLTKDKN